MVRGPLINLGGLFLHPFEPLFFLVAALIVLATLRQGALRVRVRSRMPLALFVAGAVLLLASVALSAVVAKEPGMAAKAFFKWSEIVLVALLLFWVLRTDGARRWGYWFFFASAAIYAVWFLPVSLDSQRWVRFNGYESLVALVLLLGQLRVPLWLKRSGGVILVWVALRSLSRGVWLALLVLAVWGMRRLRWRYRFLAVTGALGVAVWLVTAVPQIKFVMQQRFFTPESASNRSRTKLLAAAAEGFVTHPLLGIGAENFPGYMAARLWVQGVHEKNMAVLQVHNIFLQTAVEEGMLGIVGLLLLLAGAGSALWLADPGAWMRRPLIQVGLIFLWMLALGVLANNIRFLFGFYLGLALSLLHVAGEESPLPPGT